MRERLGRGLEDKPGESLARATLRKVCDSIVLLALSIGCAALVAQAAEDGRLPDAAATELLARAFENLYAEDYIQTMELSTTPRSGRGMTRLIQITRKQSVLPGRALIRFLEPYALRVDRTTSLRIATFNVENLDDENRRWEEIDSKCLYSRRKLHLQFWEVVVYASAAKCLRHISCRTGS